MIKSISYDQNEIIKSIIKLHVPQGFIDCDPTYSKGKFYKDKSIVRPKYMMDIKPRFDYVIRADAKELPLHNESINCLMFDPPFLATKGKSLKSKDSSNKINKRFGVYPTEKELHKFYCETLREFHRVLKNNGILIFKCQDKVSSGKQYMSHVFIHNQAVKIGFYPRDLFVLLAKNRIIADWQRHNQKHARKFHSYFWVFEKSNRKIDYI